MATYLDQRRKARLATRRDGAVRVWLFVVAGLVVAMITVGGATRLTDSGLSITEWQPILGVIPPLSEADWQAAFLKYKEIPEYRDVNAGMSLEAFRFIYWWEWSHRLLGRLIGIAFALPLLAFWIAGRLPPRLAPKLLGVLALGALQGFVGWYMVRSGLVDRVDVSHYRLALHLGLAFLILALLVWLALEVQDGPVAAASKAQRRAAVLLVALVLLQVVLGALVAGLKAGLAYNTWPLMDGRFVPAGLGTLSPWWLNVFENVTTVQFNHRVTAYALALAALWHAAALARGAGEAAAARSAAVLVLAVFAQMALGVWTLLWSVPLWLGLAHQAGAALVLVLAVWHLHRIVRGGQPALA
jgi:cytochrome c oxidase assembly protein subunit 15